MKIQEVIKKAIEGGWNDKEYRTVHHKGKVDTWSHSTSMFLDPNFWKCLGKAMEWGTVTMKRTVYPNDGNVICETMPENPDYPEYLYRWHKFIDHLAEGGSIVDYFEKL